MHHRRLALEWLEERTLLSLAPSLVDLPPGADTGLYDDDNLTNVAEPTLEITSAQPGDAIFVYRDGARLGLARQIDGARYAYTLRPGQLQEGENTITARCFDGFEESEDSPPLVVTLDTTGPRVVATGPDAPVDLKTDVLDSVTVTFNEAIQFGPDGSGSSWLEDIGIRGPNGKISPTGITDLGENEYEIAFAAQTDRGTYMVSVRPEVADLAGNLMDQDEDGQQAEPADDEFKFGADAIDAEVIFTADNSIGPGNTIFDGRDVLVNGATVTIDGPHRFNSLHLIDGARITYSGEIDTDDAFAVYVNETRTTPGLVGSYVDQSLRDYLPQDDWRESQNVAGTRTDPRIRFTGNGWGSRTEVGLTGGTDDDWENFSVQWDGWIDVFDVDDKE